MSHYRDHNKGEIVIKGGQNIGKEDKLKMNTGVPDDERNSTPQFEGDSPSDASSSSKKTIGGREPSPANPLQRNSEPSLTGQQIGDYILLRKIGAGGMGQVYLARHRRMDREVALKMLSSVAMRDPDAIKRFHREVKAAAKLFHPNIVTAFDAGDQDGSHYLVMEYVDGPSLSQLVFQQGPQPVDKAVDFIIQAAKGLQYAHSCDVVHRDIKPSNLILSSDGTIKILDMGTARFNEKIDSQNPSEAKDDLEDSLTMTGFIMGTVDFMSPEQARDAKRVDLRTDIYGLGCTLYYLLTKKTVYSGDMIQKLMKHSSAPIPSLIEACPSAPDWLEAVFQRMLAKDPDQRYQTTGQVIEDLESCSVSEHPTALDEGSRFAFPIPQALSGGSQKKTGNQKRTSIGIDLGCTSSSIAYLDDSGKPVIISIDKGRASEKGAESISSSVLIDGSNILVGQVAAQAPASKAGQIADFVKRCAGRRLYPRPIDGVEYPPEVLLSLILKQLLDIAQGEIGDIDVAAIGVPAHFDEVRRKAIQDAAFIAGLDSAEIVNEPTAVALAFAGEKKLFQQIEKDSQSKRLLVFGLGGGVFDISAIEIQANSTTTLSAAGDFSLGGCDWDERLVDLAAEQFQEEHGLDPRQDPVALLRLCRACEEVKNILSTRTRSSITYNIDDKVSKIRLGKEKFEEITQDLLKRLQEITIDVLQRAKLAWDDIDFILLAGQATQMPMIGQMLENISGRDQSEFIFLENAVVRGAAIYASLVSETRKGRDPATKIHNVNSHSLGVVGIDGRTGKRRNVILIPRNTPLPALAKKTFKTSKLGQDTVVVQILQGEKKSPRDCQSIGQCVISDLPKDLPAGSPVTVEFQYAANGRINVNVQSSTTDHQASKEISRASGLSQGQLNRWREWVETMLLCSHFDG